MASRTRNLKLIFLIFLIFSSYKTAVSQDDTGQFRFAYTEQGTYIYHLEQVPIGEAFNIYRQKSGDEDFTQLNKTPVKGVFYPDELQSYLGEIYLEISENLQTDTVEETFFTLRSRTIMGRLYTFVYPEVAQALGRMYVDEYVSIGETVTYRIEFIDDLLRPTGYVIEETVTIQEVLPPIPQNVTLSNEGYNMEIKWEYPGMENDDDQVIRFDIFEKKANSDELRKINEKLILRDNQRTQYSYFFNASSTGIENEYSVIPVSITGERQVTSEPVAYFIEDNIAPNVVQRVNGFLEQGNIEITWYMSPDPDLAGYRVYRSEDLSKDAELITEQLLDPSATAYVDSSVQEGKVFLYQVTAVDQAGNESKLSAAAMLRVEDLSAPAAPSQIEAEYLENSTVQVVWVPGPLPSDFKRFILFRRKISDTDSTIYAQISGDELVETEFLDIGVSDIGFEDGAFYEYGIQSADSSDNFSDITTVRIQIPDVTPPSPPALVSGQNIDGVRIEVSWMNSTSADIFSYQLFKEQGDSELILIDTLDRSERNFRDEQIQPGQEYRYAVSAVDSIGNISDPTFSDYILAANSDPPRQIRNVRISQRNNRLELHWEPVGSTDLAGYRVYRSTTSNGIYELLNDEPISETLFNLNEQANRYWYHVRAVDTSGNESRPSEPVRM